MKIFFIFLFIILCISLVWAAGFSPSSLVYEIEQGKTKCMNISLESESERITVIDRWAENVSVEWRASLFDKDDSYHNLDVSYDKELIQNERTLEVCLSGKDIGEYHGIIVMEEELVGNTIIQMGVWIKVNIIKPKPIESKPVTDSGSSGDKGISYSNNVPANETETIDEVVQEKKLEEYEEVPVQTENPKENGLKDITGAAVVDNSFNYNPIIWTLIIFIAIIVVAIFIIKKRKQS